MLLLKRYLDRDSLWTASEPASQACSGRELRGTVYASNVSPLVFEAFPHYGTVAQWEEKFLRFLAGLDAALRSKCLEQGATNLKEALINAERCENAREALQRDCVSDYMATHRLGDGVSVQSVLTVFILLKSRIPTHFPGWMTAWTPWLARFGSAHLTYQMVPGKWKLPRGIM